MTPCLLETGDKKDGEKQHELERSQPYCARPPRWSQFGVRLEKPALPSSILITSPSPAPQPPAGASASLQGF